MASFVKCYCGQPLTRIEKRIRSFNCCCCTKTIPDATSYYVCDNEECLYLRIRRQYKTCFSCFESESEMKSNTALSTRNTAIEQKISVVLSILS